MSIREILSSFWPSREKHVFFPPATMAERKAIHRIVKRAGGDQQKLLELASELSASNPAFTPFTFVTDGDTIGIEQQGQVLHFPKPLPEVKITLLVSGYLRWLERKYALPGFCMVENGDRVVDCGAFVGGFGLNALDRSEVHFFEPDPENFHCLGLNVSKYATARTHRLGLHSENGVLSFNRSASSVEHSFLTPDDGEAVEKIEVEVTRLDSFATKIGLEQIDFLKIEAEGLEIEVFEGAGDLPIKKIAVDVSPERDGESPRGYFEDTLLARGYNVQVRGNVLFACRSS